jgi:hypothetical protein
MRMHPKVLKFENATRSLILRIDPAQLNGSAVLNLRSKSVQSSAIVLSKSAKLERPSAFARVELFNT